MPREKIVQIVKGADGVRHLVERPSMTHQEKLAFIRTKCIEANPEIIALVRGCEIRVNPAHRRDMGIKLGYVAGVDFAVMAETESSLTHADMSLDLVRACPEKFEIIGRPITLADVLLAMNQKAETSWYWSVNTTGAWFDGRESVTHILCEWKLRKDDLNEQGEATISFLYDVLN